MRVEARAVRKAVSSSAETMAYGVPKGVMRVRDPMGAVLSVDLRDGDGRKERFDMLVLGVFGVEVVCEDCEEIVEEREAIEAVIEEAVDGE